MPALSGLSKAWVEAEYWVHAIAEGRGDSAQAAMTALARNLQELAPGFEKVTVVFEQPPAT